MSDAEGTDSSDELEYEGQIPSEEEVQSDAEAIWRKAWSKDPELRARVRPERPDGDAPPLPLDFQTTQGADPLTITLIVMAAPAVISVTKAVALDLWRKIFLPELERKWGDGSVREVPRHRRRRR
jgi:hypothetical protein